MSAGRFEDGKYQSGPGLVYACRPQPESKGLTLGGTANAYPADAADIELGSIALRKGRRSIGVIPRTVTVEFTAEPSGAIADYAGIGSTMTVPVFTAAAYDSYGRGQTGTYLGVAIRFVGKSPEVIR